MKVILLISGVSVEIDQKEEELSLSIGCSEILYLPKAEALLISHILNTQAEELS